MAARRTWPMLLLMLVVAGCSLVAKVIPGLSDTVALKSLKVVATPDANADSAVALDLVFIYDKDAEAQLPKTAPEWFADRAALQNGLGKAADVVSLQLPPATLVESVKLPDRHGKAVAVYAYARYLSGSGQGRCDLSGFKHPVLWLQAATVRITES